MKITSIKVQNFLGVSNADLICSKPVVFVAGNNGSGKTSLQQAVRFALTGKIPRVTLKKDAPEVVKAGAKKSLIRIAGDEFVVDVSFPGSVTASENKALEICLDPSLFASLPAKEAKKLLFDCVGVSVTPSTIRSMMVSRGISASHADQIVPFLRAGFPEAEKAAKDKASEARGAWKAITKETYGSQKAEGWKPAEPAPVQKPNEEAFAAIENAIRVIEAERESLNVEQDNFARVEAKREYLMSKASIDPDLQSKLDDAIAHKASATKHYEQLKKIAEHKQVETFKCCECGHEMEFDDIGNPVSHKKRKVSGDVKAALAELPKAHDEMTKYDYFIASAQKQIAEAQSAKAELESIPHAEDVSDKIATCNDDLKDLYAAWDEHVKAKEAYAAYKVELGELQLTEEEAADYHKEVCEFSAIAEAMSESGIPLEIIQSALNPVNERMAESCTAIGIPTVFITPDLGLSYSGRKYELLSESEKWRCDTVFAEAISYLSGIDVLMIDRFDVLDIPSRGAVMSWLFDVAEKRQLSNVIVFGTLKKESMASDEIAEFYWIEDGVTHAACA